MIINKGKPVAINSIRAFRQEGPFQHKNILQVNIHACHIKTSVMFCFNQNIVFDASWFYEW